MTQWIRNEGDLLNLWLSDKSKRRHYYRLSKPIEFSHEYKGRQFGHPSSFAGVKFNAAPAEQLSIANTADWPTDDQESCLHAIAMAVLDTLVAKWPYANEGCRLTLTEITWDNVGSSAFAFYLATREAMEKLLTTGTWELIQVKP